MPPSADLHGQWNHCKLDPAACDVNQIETLQGCWPIHSFSKYRPPLIKWHQNFRLRKRIIKFVVFDFFILVLCPLGFRQDMLLALRVFFKNSRRGGMYINSCFAHCQSESQDTWFGADSPRIHNKVLSLITPCLLHIFDLLRKLNRYKLWSEDQFFL